MYCIYCIVYVLYLGIVSYVDCPHHQTDVCNCFMIRVWKSFCLFDVAAFKAENHNFGLGLFLNTYFHRLSVPWLYQKYLMLKTLTEQFDKFSVEYVQ